jgi:hypothetical protein
LDHFNVIVVVINIESIIEFVEDFDGAGVGVAVECIPRWRGREKRHVLMIANQIVGVE